MRKPIWAKAVAVVAVAGALVLTGQPAFAGSGRGMSYTCTGGEVPSGTYRSLTIAGQCDVGADAVITVKGDVVVKRGAAFDAQSAPSTITVGGRVTALRGSMLGLGCQPPSLTGNSAHTCTVEPEGHSTITVRGDITAITPMAVLLNGITAKGSVTVLGGGDPYIPWSIKNNVIRGNVTIVGQTTEWIGVMFNTVHGSVTLLKIHLNDPDPGAPGVYIVQNKITRNLVCLGLTPGVSGGFVPGAVNVVGGRVVGQCTALV